MGAVKSVIFDMDGTITEPNIDFLELRRRIGCTPERGILDFLENTDEETARKGWDILLEVETGASRESKLNDGIREVLEEIERRGITTCLVTNNCRESVDIISEKHEVNFSFVLTREDGKAKPDPTLLHKALERMQVAPEEAIFVGDGGLDLVAGTAAGIKTILLRRVNTRDLGAPYYIDHLAEVLDFLG